MHTFYPEKWLPLVSLWCRSVFQVMRFQKKKSAPAISSKGQTFFSCFVYLIVGFFFFFSQWRYKSCGQNGTQRSQNKVECARYCEFQSDICLGEALKYILCLTCFQVYCATNMAPNQSTRPLFHSVVCKPLTNWNILQKTCLKVIPYIKVFTVSEL